jgi:hypothetical protein
MAILGGCRRSCRLRKKVIRRKRVSLKKAERFRGTTVARKIGEATGRDMNRSLIVPISLICAAPLYAQGQQQNVVKLMADAQKVVSIISGDKAKTQTYCQIANLGGQMDQAVKEKDKKKFDELRQGINEAEKQLGPEYLALIDALKDVDQNSKDAQEIVSIFDRLDESCPH